MPFRTVPDLPADPTMRVYFSGLMILHPSADEQSCQVFVHRRANNHDFSIWLLLKQPRKLDVVLMRHVGLLKPIPGESHGFLIEVAPGQRGVRKYDGSNPTQEPEAETLGLAINLQDLHSGKTRVDETGGRPSLFLNDAIFYTAQRTDPGLVVDLMRGGSKVKRLTPFTSLIGANIYLDQNQKIVVRRRESGRVDELELPRPASGSRVVVRRRQGGQVDELQLMEPPAGSSYEIYISNDPPVLLPTPHDELTEYYDVLPDVPQRERFTLDFPSAVAPQAAAAKSNFFGSTRTPCMPVIVEP